MTSVFDRAYEILLDGRVVHHEVTDDLIWGEVIGGGGESNAYTPWVGRGVFGCGCTSFTMKPGLCKHIAAILLKVPQYDLMEWIVGIKHG